MTSTVTSLAFVYSTVYSGADQRKHQMPRPHSADHFRRSFMIVAEPSDRGLLLLISGTKCCPIPPVRLKYDCFTNKVRDWYDWSVWPALRMFSAIFGTTTGTIDAIAMWTIALTLFFCYHDWNDPTDHSTIPARFWQPSHDHWTLYTTASTLPLRCDRPTSRPCVRSGVIASIGFGWWGNSNEYSVIVIQYEGCD